MLLRTHHKPQPITLVNVVENDDRASQRAQRMHRLLNDQARFAAGGDTPVNTVVTIDNNVAGGIIRTAKETGSNVILLGWSDRVTLLERLFGPKTDTLLRNYHQLVLVTRITRPLPSHRRLLLVCPPLAEREPGFVQWVDKVQRMAKELGLRSEVLAERSTHDALLSVLAAQRSSFAPALVPLEEGVELEERMARHAQPNDLVVLVSARPRSISHHASLDHLPRRLDKQFQDLSLILVYPASEAVPEDILELN
jgi:hypothetical protein